MIKVLVTSVGSLVGQNILDVLENRRQHVTLVGINSIAESQRIYRCDTAYLVPETSSPKFESVLDDILRKENPDLVLAGRDYDVAFLANYRRKELAKNTLIPIGDSYLAQMMVDKYETHLFTEKYGLPFASTLLYRDISDTDSLNAFIEKHGFPLLVKPRQGFGSLNVSIVTNQTQVDSLVKDGKEVLFQEYLSPAEDLDHYLEQLTKGIPLSFQIPIHDHMVSQVVISKDGTLLDYISTKQSLVMGRTEYAVVYDEPDLNQMIELYAKTLANSGWWGFLNIQSRQDQYMKWKAFELNPRMSGASSTRLNLGLDELGLLLQAEKPEWLFPIQSDPTRKQNHIFKYLSDHLVEDTHIKNFRTKGYWNK